VKEGDKEGDGRGIEGWGRKEERKGKRERGGKGYKMGHAV